MAVCVLDYHKGNLMSVARGLDRAGADVVVSDDPEVAAASDGLVIPGVGAFADAMGYMEASGQAEAVAHAHGRGVPILGICLGMQLFCSRGREGSEGWRPGLGFLSGGCTRLESGHLKVPHVGWDELDITPLGRACPLLVGVGEGSHMYFTHSFALDGGCDPDVVCAKTHYARSFPSVVWSGNLFGCQFHPEKSSGAGRPILENFVALVKGGLPL